MADLIPVIKARMGERDYYIGSMTFQDLAAKVMYFEDLKTSEDLDKLLQREMTKRAEEMTTYILRQKERFYGAIIIAAWGGNPGFVKVKMQDHPLLDDDFNFGLLKFDGKQEYFALDGQHRLASIKQAIERDPKNTALRKEEVSVVILTHEQTEQGNIKTRRLFHTLNRYAKPTTTGENVALDEDNVISIGTRMLLKNIKLLDSQRLELKSKNVSSPEKFTSLATLFEFNSDVLESIYNFNKEYLRFRPAAEHIERVYDTISSLWLFLIKQVRELADVEAGLAEPGTLREPGGDPAKGHVLFRPVGLSVFGRVLAVLIRESMQKYSTPDQQLDPKLWVEVWKRAKHLPLILGELPWKGTIFRNNRMENSAKGLATKLAIYMLGSDQVDNKKLLEEYQGHLDDDTIGLPAILVGAPKTEQQTSPKT